MVKIQFVQAKRLDELQEKVNECLETIPTSCVRDIRYESLVSGTYASLTGMIIYEEEWKYGEIS